MQGLKEISNVDVVCPISRMLSKRAKLDKEKICLLLENITAIKMLSILIKIFGWSEVFTWELQLEQMSKGRRVFRYVLSLLIKFVF